MAIKDNDIERVNMMKFVDVFSDDNSSWKELIKHFKKKIAKNIGLMNKENHF